MKTISYIKRLQDKVNNINKDLPNIESKINSNNTIINNAISKISNINAPLSNLLNKTDTQIIRNKINKLIEIKITDADPNEQIIATCGDKTIKTQADSTGTGYLNPTKYGDWSVNGKLLSVTSARQYELNMLPDKAPLSAMSWKDIAKVSESGKASEYWKIGDEKDITLTTNEILTFQIYGFNHDDLADGSGKAGITFGMKNLMKKTHKVSTYTNNLIQYNGSDIHKYLTNEVYPTLPSELQLFIKIVDVDSDERIFLFDIANLSKEEAKYSDRKPYPIFTDDNSRIKKLSNGTGPAATWASRNANTAVYDSWYGVYLDGTTDSEALSIDDETNGVCFGFCI